MKGCLAGSEAENLLEQGDMVLAINKEPVTCFRDIEKACHALDISDNNKGRLNMTIFRQVKKYGFELSKLFWLFMILLFGRTSWVFWRTYGIIP